MDNIRIWTNFNDKLIKYWDQQTNISLKRRRIPGMQSKIKEFLVFILFLFEWIVNNYGKIRSRKIIIIYDIYDRLKNSNNIFLIIIQENAKKEYNNKKRKFKEFIEEADSYKFDSKRILKNEDNVHLF